MNKWYDFRESLQYDFDINYILEKYIKLYGNKTPVWFENIDNTLCIVDTEKNKYKAVWSFIDNKVVEPVLIETKEDKINRLCDTLQNTCSELIRIIKGDL